MAEAVAANVPATTGGDEPKKPLFGLTFLENLADMSMLRQIGLLVGLAASVAIGFAVVLWSQQPDYQPLYGSLDGMDASQVMETLSAADIKYTVEPNSGALLVKSGDLARARMRLAAAGVAPKDNSVGFEILDQEQGLGTSQFMEATRYRRGLEGELARTVSSLNNVKAARVHLAIPKSSVFVRDERKPSASVLVELYSGRGLEPSQVMAIVNLVENAIRHAPEAGHVPLVQCLLSSCPATSAVRRTPRGKVVPVLEHRPELIRLGAVIGVNLRGPLRVGHVGPNILVETRCVLEAILAHVEHEAALVAIQRHRAPGHGEQLFAQAQKPAEGQHGVVDPAAAGLQHHILDTPQVFVLQVDDIVAGKARVAQQRMSGFAMFEGGRPIGIHKAEIARSGFHSHVQLLAVIHSTTIDRHESDPGASR